MATFLVPNFFAVNYNMKDAILLLLAGTVVFLLVWNAQSTAYAPAQSAAEVPVQADITQVLLEEVQKSEVDLVPLETLFVNPQSNGSYAARFMFLNTTGFYGVQYDIQATVSPSGAVNILAMTQTARPDYSAAYVPDKYQPYTAIKDNLDKQLKDAVASYNEAQKKSNK